MKRTDMKGRLQTDTRVSGISRVVASALNQVSGFVGMSLGFLESCPWSRYQSADMPSSTRHA